MSQIPTPSVTADEAVARIINVDYIPEGFTLLEMTAAFLEDADTDYENARSDHLPEDQKSLLAIRAHICETRHQLAQQMLEGLELELASTDCRIVRVDTDTANTAPHFDMASLTDWAFHEFGIGAPAGSNFGRGEEQSAAALNWEQITIKIYADSKLGVKASDGKYRRSSFRDVGLLSKKENIPNVLGGILIGLSQRKKFPPGKDADGKFKTAISKLRGSLKKLTGISADPFNPFNPGDGWRPRFKLIDDQRNADDRAKKEAVHVSLDEARDFDDEDDAGAKWLAQRNR